MLVKLKSLGDDWTLVRGQDVEKSEIRWCQDIRAENQEGMTVILYVKYIPRLEEEALSQKTFYIWSRKIFISTHVGQVTQVVATRHRLFFFRQSSRISMITESY
jgi:hypothetical protein